MDSHKAYLRGTLTTIILALLREKEELYGYEICQLTKQRTNEEILLTEGAIYPALHRLEKEGLISSRKKEVNGRTRKYYQITSEQHSVVDKQIQALIRFTNNLDGLLKPSKN